MAEAVVAYLIEEGFTNNIEFSDRINGFKLKISLSKIPPQIAQALRSCTRETTSTFSGKLGTKIRILSAGLLSEESVLQLKSQIDTVDFADWVEQSNNDSDQLMTDLGNEFYQLLAG